MLRYRHLEVVEDTKDASQELVAMQEANAGGGMRQGSQRMVLRWAVLPILRERSNPHQQRADMRAIQAGTQQAAQQPPADAEAPQMALGLCELLLSSRHQARIWQGLQQTLLPARSR